ncbi:MAG: ankyrin repeat domain-containing protein [Acetatifactor sp.]|nr:ankyrin repeat domain-containing protein [Acetatifactor sp.]
MNDRLNRDEMFYRIADINIPKKENKVDVLETMKSIKNPNFQDLNGTSYLHMACQTHCIESIKILLELGANPNINDNRGFSPVTSALGSINNNNAEILKLMLQYGLNLKKMEGGQTLKEWIEMFDDEELNEIIRKKEQSFK